MTKFWSGRDGESLLADRAKHERRLRPYRGKDRRALASLRFCVRVVMTVGRITTFMPRAAIAAASDLSAGSITNAPVKSAYSLVTPRAVGSWPDRKSTRLNSSHQIISYAVFCLKKKKS